MLLLLACAPPPLDLAVAPPHAEHAIGEPVASFVGPLGELACDADLARALRRGEAGWRVLAVAEDRVQLPDGTVETTSETPALDALVKRWADADAAYATRCGHPPETHVLVAADAGARMDTVVVARLRIRGTSLRLLVAGEPQEPHVSLRPAPREVHDWSVLTRTPTGWSEATNLIAGVHGIRDLPEHARWLAEAGDVMVVVAGAATAPVSSVVPALDTLVGVGITPALSLTPGQDTPAPSPTPAGHVRLAIGDIVPVLALAPMPDLPEPTYELDAPEEKISPPSPAR